MADYTELKELTDRIDELIDESVTSSSMRFKVWQEEAGVFLHSYYGKTSIQCGNFTKTKFYPATSPTDDDKQKDIIACKEDLEFTKEIFKGYLKKIQSMRGHSVGLDS